MQNPYKSKSVANPQLENGYTPIANEILEKLARLSLSSNQWQVLLVIIRKTYGFHKKVDYIANFQIGTATGLGKTVVSRILRNLNDRHIITSKGKVVGLQKDWGKWQGLSFQPPLDSKLAGQLTPQEVSSIANQSKQSSQPELAKQSTKVSSSEDTQKIKDTLTKETIQKKDASNKKYGEFNNVSLSDNEYEKLKDKFSEAGANERIETLSAAIASKGYKYKSHYATILSWDRRDLKKKGASGELPSTKKLKEEWET